MQRTKLDINDLRAQTETPHLLFNFLTKNGLIHCNHICQTCQADCYMITVPKSPAGRMWHCGKCSKNYSLFQDTIFFQQKTSPMNQLIIMHYFATTFFPIEYIAIQSHVSNSTVEVYFKVFRNLIQMNNYSVGEKIGGLGHTIQVDETCIAKRKYHVGRIVPNGWIVGGIDENTNLCFGEYTENRDTQTLETIIRKFVHPGTKIITDGWGGYNFLDKADSGYFHDIVIHNENFVDPISGANTQKIERFWRSLKLPLLTKFGMSRDNIPLYVVEFCWKHNVGARSLDHFSEFLDLVKK